MRLSHHRLGISLLTATLSASLAGSASAQDEPPPPPPQGRPAPPAPPPPQTEAVPTERTANNALYVEGLGAGLFYSLNYDHAFGPVAGRAGIGYFAVSSGGSSTTWVSIPLTVSYLGLGGLKHMFEVGAGVSINYFGRRGSLPGAGASAPGAR